MLTETTSRGLIFRIGKKVLVAVCPSIPQEGYLNRQRFMNSLPRPREHTRCGMILRSTGKESALAGMYDSKQQLSGDQRQHTVKFSYEVRIV